MIAFALALGACATLEPPEVAKPRAPPPLSRIESLVLAHRQKAEAFERDGDLRKALDEWTIALTINPDDAAAKEGKKKLLARIAGALEERMRQGREALGRGAHLEARRHFLAVLAMDPANKPAFEALRDEVREIRLIAHTVRQGETLASIAQRYYGDRSRSEVIWEVNQLPPNPRLAVGTALKIPEIPGVPFVDPSARQEATRGAPSRGEPREEFQESNPMLVEAKEAFEKGEFTVALADIEKVLASNPQNAEGIDLKKSVLYGQGKSELAQKKYEDSYRTFNALVRLTPNYQDAVALLGQARVAMIQERYNEGIRFYREEKLEAAIVQWKRVLEFDPNHANAKRNIEQAERLLKGLQQRQQPKR